MSALLACRIWAPICTIQVCLLSAFIRSSLLHTIIPFSCSGRGVLLQRHPQPRIPLSLLHISHSLIRPTFNLIVSPLLYLMSMQMLQSTLINGIFLLCALAAGGAAAWQSNPDVSFQPGCSVVSKSILRNGIPPAVYGAPSQNIALLVIDKVSYRALSTLRAANKWVSLIIFSGAHVTE